MKLKLFPKTFLYTLGINLFIVLFAHITLYLLAPQEILDFTFKTLDEYDISARLNVENYFLETIQKVLPLSLICCVVISVICSLLFSRKMTVPIKKISKVTEKMSRMDKTAVCEIRSKDEIGVLGENINSLYHSLLSVVESLEAEKQRVSENEKSKVDFLRAASHELKTPVTALNATLENMILKVGKYKDYDVYLPECKEMIENIGTMIQKILDTSKIENLSDNETAVDISLSEFLTTLCEPYILIAKAHSINFNLDLKNSFSANLPLDLFRKALSNIIANAVDYTPQGKTISVYFSGRSLIVENECTPISDEHLQHIFEPFYRPDYSRNRDSGGNGLGLYIVSALLKKMNILYSFQPIDDPLGMRFTIAL